MSKLNFAIALKMTTDQFKKGVGVVKSGIKQLQYQAIGMASALGLGGIGLSNLASRFIDVARETTRARVALRNISGDAGGFKKNMDFLMGSSNRWGQELNAMTAEFSKFSAAASSAGISIQDQHSIFESFTRSITAFGMKSEDAHLAYLALSQMMSKGKISSEELRRQLGERMPVAMEAMARAVGVTIQELDGLLKAGKLVSKDVMLPFVKEMEKMLPEVNTDNIETSVNRLKNTFTQLTQDLKIGEYFKKIVDWANGMLGNIQTSFMRVVAVIVAAFTSGKIAKAYSSLTQKVIAENQKVLANKVQTEQQLELATAKRVAAEKRYNEISALYSKATNEQKIQYYAKLTAAESAMNKARLREQAGMKAVQEANAAQMVTRWGVAYNGLKKIAISAIAAIKAAFSTILPMAVIGLITNFVMKLIEARKEAKEIKNIFSEYRKEAESLSTPQEVMMLETSLSILTNKKSTQEEINKAQSSLNSLLGTEINNQDELIKKGRERIGQLYQMAEAQFYMNKSISAQDELNSIYSKYGGADGMDKKLRLRDTWSRFKKSIGIDSQIDRDYARIQELQKVVADAGWKLDAAAKAGVGLSYTTTTGATPSGSGSKAPENIKAERLFIENIKEAFKIGEVKPITQSPFIVKQDRDTTFDYKKSQSDILSEEKALQEEYIEKLMQDAISLGKYGSDAMNQIYQEEQKLTSLSDALKLAQLKEDIKEMNLSIFEQSIDGVTGFADALDRIANSWQRVSETLEDTDTSGFERLVSVINAAGDSIKGLIGVWESYKTVQELINQLSSARSSLSTAEAASEVTKIGSIADAQVAADIATATSAGTRAVATVGAFTAEEIAARGVMAAGAAAAYAAIPVLGPTLAAGQITAMEGLIAGSKIASLIPGFYDGGIVNSIFKTGDKNLVRVNGGEMITTTAQQSKLWNAIEKGNFGRGLGGEIKVRIEGKDLVGTLNQFNKYKSRV